MTVKWFVRSTPARAAVTDPAPSPPAEGPAAVWAPAGMTIPMWGPAGVPVSVLVGGVSELFQSDLDVGRLAVEQLLTEDLGPGVRVEEMHYGAVAVAQRLEELSPQMLVLVSAVKRDRPAGTATRVRLDPAPLDPAQVQAAVGDAVTGYVHPDLVVDIAHALGFLPARTVAIEVEPEVTGTGDGLSAAAARGLHTALGMIRTELRRAPLLALADQLRPLVHDQEDRLEDSLPLDALKELLDELVLLDREGRWGHTFALRDRFKLAIGHSNSSEGMDAQDWALWWLLIEQLDQLEAHEATQH